MRSSRSPRSSTASSRAEVKAFLLLFGLALAAKGSVAASPALWGAAVLVLVIVAWLFDRPDAPLKLTPLAAAVFGYAAWLLILNQWVNPYNAAASYDAAFLVAGFVIGWRAGRERLGLLFALALAFTAALAVWSIWQRISAAAPRGHAVFETPATFASTINLLLVPGLVVVAAGKRNPWLLGSLVVLAAALVGTASRGAWLALGMSALAALVLWRRAAMSSDRRLAMLAAVVGAGIVLSLLTPLTKQLAFGTVVESGGNRLDLYKAAIAALDESSLIFGSGYLNYRYVLEAARPTIPGYVQGITFFVHNDYLQALLESGLPGLAFLALMATLPAVYAWRQLPQAPPDDRPMIIALGAGMSSMAVHALMDFPFYIAMCLVIYGACAGLLCAFEPRREPRIRTERPTAARQLAQVVRALVVAGLFWVLARPVAAETAAYYASREWSEGRVNAAAYWFEAARRIESKDWRFHGLVGEFWFVQAQAGTNVAAARLAERAFEDGIAANPREVSNLLWLIGTHIHLRKLLPEPADAAKLRRWADQALALAPLDPRVRLQRDLVARFESRGAPAR